MNSSSGPLHRVPESRTRTGYSLIEVMVAVGILSVVSVLSFIVLRSSNEAVSLATAKSEVQGNLRDVMAAISREVEAAFIPEHVSRTPERMNAEDIEVLSDGREIRFWKVEQSPNSLLPVEVGPLRIFLESEDLGLVSGNPMNAKLDPGEDENGDGALTRRVVLERDDTERTLAAANDVADLQFALLPSNNEEDERLTRLQVTLTASRRHGFNNEHLVTATLTSVIQMSNY